MKSLSKVPLVDGAGEGRVIKRAALAHYRTADAQLENARAQAEQLLQAAQSQAEEIQSDGFRAGVVWGVQAALAPLLELAITLARSENELNLRASQLVQDCFSDVLATAPALQTVLDMVIAARGLKSGSTLQMTIPSDAADCAEALRAHGAAQGMAVIVDTGHERGRLAIECAGHHWETDIEALAQCVPPPSHTPLLQESDVRMRLAQALREAAAQFEA